MKIHEKVQLHFVMFENAVKVGPSGDYAKIEEAVAKCEEKTALLLMPGEYVLTEPLEITKSVTIQAENPDEAIIKAPSVVFNTAPSVFTLLTNVVFEAHVEVKGGATTSFEYCKFTAPEGSGSIVSVTDSSPNFRYCTFHDFEGIAAEYNGSRGGIITDCTFEKIKGDTIKRNGEAKPFADHNTTK